MSRCVSVDFSWLLYEKPGFQGRVLALEEGPTHHVVNMWADEGPPDQMSQPPAAPVTIGSVRLAVRVRPLSDPTSGDTRQTSCLSTSRDPENGPVSPVSHVLGRM